MFTYKLMSTRSTLSYINRVSVGDKNRHALMVSAQKPNEMGQTLNVLAWTINKVFSF